MLTKTIRRGDSFHDFKKKSDTAQFPVQFCDYVKSFGEIYFWEKGNFHIITRTAHAKEILTSPDFSADRGAFFVSRMPKMDLGLIQDFFGVVQKMMVMSDDDDHTKRRRFAAVGFEDHVLEKFKMTLKKCVSSLVADLKDKKNFEFVESISRQLPSTVLADLFSIPEEDREDFLRWSNIMTGFFGGASQYLDEDGIEVNQAALALKTYFSNLVAKRLAEPGDDYVSIVLQKHKNFNLEHDEIISQLIMMLVAGMATTTDQINNCMFLLASHPQIQREVRANKHLIPQMLEEFKRFDPAVTFIFRVARKETQIGGQPIAKGDVVFISSHLVNRDLPDSQRPLELNIHRKAPHMAYGFGAHHCIGAKLARIEMNSLFEELITQLPPLQVSTLRASERDHYSLSFSGFKTLYLETV